VDVAAVTEDAVADASGIAHAAVLLAFAEAAVGGDEATLAAARQRVLDALGPEALVDTAAVVGNFERMTRIADSTGIPLDAPVAAMTQDIRSDLGLDEFGSARNTPPLGAVGRFLGRALRPVALQAFRLIGFRAKRDA
jgi:hypothetical protein